MEFSEVELPSTGPYITFVGKICSKLKQDDNDCVFEVDATEYNNFSFTNKGRINFKVQVVFEAGPNSRIRKFTLKLEIKRLIFISEFLNLSDDNLPFAEAKKNEF